MFLKNIKTLTVVSTLLTLNACTHLNEGEIDYAKTTIASEKNGTDYLSLLPKYTPVDAINSGETISIHLSGAFAHDLPEPRSVSEHLQGIWKTRKIGANAEVAVIASVCEQGINGCGAEFGPGALDKGRVVYFSDSVKDRQQMNFSYLPIYGPIKYTGKTLIIQLAIVELDTTNEQQKNLIKNLAAIGGKSYPPASKVLQAIDKLGSSLLQGNHHDIAFRYDLTLVSNGGEADVKHPKLSAGNYVFIRKERLPDKQKESLWDKVELNTKTGKLIKQGTGNQNDGLGEEFRDNTYLVLQVQKGFQEASLDNQQTLATLTEELAKKNNKRLEDINKVLSKAGSQLARQAKIDAVGKYVPNLREKQSDIDNNKNLSPADKQEKKDRQLIAAQKIWDLVQSADTEYANNNCDSPTTDAEKENCSQTLTNDQFTQVKVELRGIIVSKSPAASPVNLNQVCPLKDRGILIPGQTATQQSAQRQAFIKALTN
ncbi:hypothetical protein QSV34_14505 [Porticoccus sp. W117]|uniref:hypothetical protein n=1 Tax=Porticoccus sp. W117 TaxID=3054777 RepID=UPI002599E5B6|nr:hypothetical protein [Porticoccus sp. W117]MDM3872561.1 hypothetical protein [Porticoccus sp. W117]